MRSRVGVIIPLSLIDVICMYEVIIIGGGPAAIAAGVYAARKQLKTLVIAKEFGGQSIVSPGIQNWIGTIEISGDDLAKSLTAHLKAYAGTYVEIIEGVTADRVSGTTGAFTVQTSDGSEYSSSTVLVASGAQRRKLTVPGASEYDQKGLTYCATCDGPLFSGMDVAVIGGGNAGFESAAQLLAYVKSVTLLDTGTSFRADPVTVEKVTAHPNMRALSSARIDAVHGSGMVNGITYTDTREGVEHTLSVGGVFVEIGMVPNTSLVDGLLSLDTYKKIVVDPRNQRTSLEGVWAAGDCTNELYSQNNIAVGDAVKALEDIYAHLRA
jgi:NADH-dependent peroxiredoxin subunit F